MRKLFGVLAFFVFFLAFAFSVSAQTPTPRGQQIRQEVKQRVVENRQEKIRAFFERMMDRFEAAIERLEKLIERIESRIEKADMETPEELGDAKGKLDMAKGKMEDLKDDFEDLLASDDPRAVFKTVGGNVRDLKSDLVEIHRILVHIIGDIRGLRVGGGSPSPTP